MCDFSQSKKQEDDETHNRVDCSICMEVITERDNSVLSCGHRFHTSCLLENAIKANNTCPLCRITISKKADILPDLNKETIYNFIQISILKNKGTTKKCLHDLIKNCSPGDSWDDLSNKKKNKCINLFIEHLVEYGLTMGTNISKWIESGNDRIQMDEDELVSPSTIQTILESREYDNLTEVVFTDINTITTDPQEECIVNAPERFMVQGRIGLSEEYMGIYVKDTTRAIRNAPLYTMNQEDDVMFLFKGTRGYWLFTDDEYDMVCDVGAISSKDRDMDLPNEEDGVYEYAGSDSWVVDSLIKVFEDHYEPIALVPLFVV